jgi:hypothetical protein
MVPTRTTPDESERLPYPEESATVRLWPDAGRLLRLGRSATFEAHRRGELPFTVWKIGNRLVVPTAQLRAVLGLPTTRPDDG